MNFSAGWALWELGEKPTKLIELIEHADPALQKAKHAGTNRVVTD